MTFMTFELARVLFWAAMAGGGFVYLLTRIQDKIDEHKKAKEG